MRDLIVKLPLIGGKFTIIDKEDFDRVSKYKWCLNVCNENLFYATSIDEKRKIISLHRVIMNLLHGDHKLVDHIDGDGLNNRKSNLRICSDSQNQHNKRVVKKSVSGFKGVTLHKKRRLWRARIMLPNGKNKELGYFYDKFTAAEVYDEAALKYFGEFAKTNKMMNLYDKVDRDRGLD